VLEGLGFYNINYCGTARPKTGDENHKKRPERKLGQAQLATQDTPCKQGYKGFLKKSEDIKREAW
jgi:hypothetical protein